MPGSTTARGYGHPHQQARRRALAAFRDGDPCNARYRDGPHAGQLVCGGRPMWSHQPLDLCHSPAGGYEGLGHASCNRREGMVHFNQVKKRRHSRQW